MLCVWQTKCFEKNQAKFEQCIKNFLLRTLWEGFWGIVIFGVEIENIGNELEIDSDLQVGY